MGQTRGAKYPEAEWTFEYSPESFTNTEMDYAVEICEAVMDVMAADAATSPASSICRPPWKAPRRMCSPTRWNISPPISAAATAIILSVHTHNDRGCAVAAAELAVLAGADRVEGTLLGNGERTGNMDIVTMAMNLYSQGVDPELDISNPDEIIQVVAECTSIPLHPRHPWVGELVYTAFSGSHQDAIRKCLHKQQPDEHWQVAYLPIDPKDIGRDYQAVIRVNSQSGKGGVAFVLERDYGLSLPRWMQVELAQLVQQRERAAQRRDRQRDAFMRCSLQHFVADQCAIGAQRLPLDRADGQD